MKTIKKISVRKNVLATKKKGSGICQSISGNRSSGSFAFCADKLLQRTNPAESGMGICRSICRQIHFRHTYGTLGRVPANDTGL